jgi:hypothetical protein
MTLGTRHLRARDPLLGVACMRTRSIPAARARNRTLHKLFVSSLLWSCIVLLLVRIEWCRPYVLHLHISIARG